MYYCLRTSRRPVAAQDVEVGIKTMVLIHVQQDVLTLNLGTLQPLRVATINLSAIEQQTSCSTFWGCSPLLMGKRQRRYHLLESTKKQNQYWIPCQTTTRTRRPPILQLLVHQPGWGPRWKVEKSPPMPENQPWMARTVDHIAPLATFRVAKETRLSLACATSATSRPVLAIGSSVSRKISLTLSGFCNPTIVALV